MAGSSFTLLTWLRARAENVLVLLLATMFVAFIVQIVFRYLLNFPVGWTSELSTVVWIWLVLWGAAFVVREDEEIRFDLVYGSVGVRARQAMTIAAAAAVIVLYGMSLPAVVDYVTFMKVQETAYLDIRFDYLWAIYVVFAVASIVRYLWLAWRAIRSDGVAAPDPRDTTSGI
jgi:TRAP-type C4-dicarboxylate transport system permease small subunit